MSLLEKFMTAFGAPNVSIVSRRIWPTCISSGVNIHWSWSDNEKALRADMKTQAAEMLEGAGCRDVTIYDDDAPMGFSVHEMGTARMGRDPKTSVLNAHNQAHDAPNLFVTDGACMASSSCVNPSLTYMALTARAVDHAVKELNRRNL